MHLLPTTEQKTFSDFDSFIESERKVKPTSVHYLSGFQGYATPWDLYNECDDEFHFTIDLAAEKWNAKHPNFISPEEDAFSRPWEGVCWLNPEYGRALPRWIKRAAEAARNGDATVVTLIAARPDSKIWHDVISRFASEIRFLRGRVRFSTPDGEAQHVAAFPSAIVIFRPEIPEGGPKVSFVSLRKPISQPLSATNKRIGSRKQSNTLKSVTQLPGRSPSSEIQNVQTSTQVDGEGFPLTRKDRNDVDTNR